MFNFSKKGKEHSTHKCSIIGSGMNKSGLGFTLIYSDDEINPKSAKKKSSFGYVYHTLPDTIKSYPLLAILPRCSLNGWDNYISINPSMVFISLDTLYDAARSKDYADFKLPYFDDRANRKWKIAIYTSTASKVVVEPGAYTIKSNNMKLYDFNLNDSNVSDMIIKVAKLDLIGVDGIERKCGMYGAKFCLVPNDTNGFTINIDQYGIVTGIN